MAEAVVVPLIEKLGVALAMEIGGPVFSWLLEKMSLLVEARARMDRIRSEFVVMEAFLRCETAWRAGEEPLVAWVEGVRDVAYHVEDVIDEYCHLVSKQQRKGGFRGFLWRLAHPSGNLNAWQSIAAQLQEVEAKLLNLSNAKDRFGIKMVEGARFNGNDERRRHLDEAAVHFVGEEDVVGIDTNKSLLVQWLLAEEEPQCRTISVWGMGGMGKTTLAASAYRSQIIKRHFSCYAWVSVSQVYRADELLRRIIKEFFDEMDVIPFNVDAMDYRRLMKTLRSYLQNKRYLIILDDVWHVNVWSDVCGAFPECRCGSRIVITTRNRDVALLANERHVIELQQLRESEAWELFCRKAFSREERRGCPPELEYWARMIVDKCKGLPLSITVIGSLLSQRERKELEWKKVHDRLNWELASNTEHDRVNNILNLSLDDLPGHLKSCFLYCSIFPEDHLIHRKRLIRLWVAEGFVGERAGNTMEEAAEDYLNQLIHLCMLQVVKRNSFGRVKACRMHDLMREPSLSRCRRENFCRVCDSLEASQAVKARHLSVHRRSGGSGSRHPGDIRPSGSRWRPRSLIMFDVTTNTLSSPQSACLAIPQGFKLLRVLDLQDVPLSNIPEQVASMFNLRHLGLRNTRVEGLPRSLRRLHNLQTLDLWGTRLHNLPGWTTRLVNLRHLFVFKPDDRSFRSFSALPGADAPRGLSILKNLQTLCYVEANVEMVRGVGELTQLRTFGITKVRAAHCAELCASIAQMGRLLTLAVAAADEGESLRLDNLTPPPPLLQKLALWGRMEKGSLPPWLGSLVNLTNLTLYWCQLGDDPLPTLSGLPNLVHLYLRNAYEGQVLCFFPASFPNLKSLFLVDMARLQWVRIEEGALAGLRQLALARCRELKAVPLGIEHLGPLQELFLREMSPELAQKLHGQGEEDGGTGGDRRRIERIPIVTHVFQRDGEWIREVRRSKPTGESIFGRINSNPIIMHHGT